MKIWLVSCSAFLTLACATKEKAADSGTTSAPDGAILEQIGPAGGSLTAADGKLVIGVPAGALDQEVRLWVHPLAAPPAGALGTVYELGPSGTIFAKPVTLTLSLAALDLQGETSTLLLLATYDQEAAEWLPLAGAVDPAGTAVTGETAHLSIFGLPKPSVIGSFSSDKPCPAGFYASSVWCVGQEVKTPNEWHCARIGKALGSMSVCGGCPPCFKKVFALERNGICGEDPVSGCTAVEPWTSCARIKGCPKDAGPPDAAPDGPFQCKSHADCKTGQSCDRGRCVPCDYISHTEGKGCAVGYRCLTFQSCCPSADACMCDAKNCICSEIGNGCTEMNPCDPAGTEICGDFHDNDCDGQSDEGCAP